MFSLNFSDRRLRILGFCSCTVFLVAIFAKSAMAGMPGGITNVNMGENNAEILELARFAVSEHNSKQNGNLEFVNLVSAKKQVVAGLMYYLTIEAESGGQRGHYEAKVWSKPWVNHKSLEDFKFVGAKMTSADLGALGHGGGGERAEPSGVTRVAVNDPSVTEAAEHALKAIQSSSNSLFPYELKEIVSAHAERGDGALFKVIMRLKRGMKEEKCNAEVHCNEEGAWNLRSFKIE